MPGDGGSSPPMNVIHQTLGTDGRHHQTEARRHGRIHGRVLLAINESEKELTLNDRRLGVSYPADQRRSRHP